MMQETLTPHAIESAGIFSGIEIERLKQEHLTGVRKHSKLLFSLLMFQLWHAQNDRAARSGRAAQSAATFAA
jgi:hypothetical protein